MDYSMSGTQFPTDTSVARMFRPMHGCEHSPTAPQAPVLNFTATPKILDLSRNLRTYIVPEDETPGRRRREASVASTTAIPRRKEREQRHFLSPFWRQRCRS